MVYGYYYGIQYKSTSVYNNMSVPLVKVCLRRVPFGFYDPQHAAKHQSLQKCRYKYQIRHKITLKGMKSTGWITITGVHTHVPVHMYFGWKIEMTLDLWIELDRQVMLTCK